MFDNGVWKAIWANVVLPTLLVEFLHAADDKDYVLGVHGWVHERAERVLFVLALCHLVTPTREKLQQFVPNSWLWHAYQHDKKLGEACQSCLYALSNWAVRLLNDPFLETESLNEPSRNLTREVIIITHDLQYIVHKDDDEADG